MDSNSEYLEMPEIGIRFRWFNSREMSLLVSEWRDRQENMSHVYEVSVELYGKEENLWMANGKNDGHLVFTLTSKGRSRCERLALAAMKSWLRKGHRKTAMKSWLRKGHRKTANKAARIEPPTPEEEMEMTVERQKEDS